MTPRVAAIASALVALALWTPNSHSAEKENVHDRLVAFRDRVGAIYAGEEAEKDGMGAKALAEFGKTVNDGELGAVADFGVSKEGANIRWPLVRLLVERGKFDAAAKLAATGLVVQPKDREYGLWKWWEANFSNRKDYRELKRSSCDALLRQFGAGSAETKLAVSEVFGKGKAEAQLPLKMFKDAIHYNRQAEPKPEQPSQPTRGSEGGVPAKTGLSATEPVNRSQQAKTVNTASGPGGGYSFDHSCF